MTSAAQLAANRLNALASTGPRTDAGRAASAQNALRHGLAAKAIVIPGEDPAEFARFHADFCARLQPADAVEALLVDRIVACAWRLQRIVRIEREVMESFKIGTHYTMFDKVTAGIAFQHDARDGGDVLGKLARHEAVLEKGVFRALHELERLQAARSGREVPVPAAAVDVSLEVDGALRGSVS